MIDKTNWTPCNIAWIAGILDGEGCFSPHFDRRHKITSVSLCVRCNMTDEDTIERCREVAGFGTIIKLDPPSRKGHKLQWRWESRVSPDVYKFEIAILPWMSARRTQQILDSHNKRREYELLSDKINGNNPSRNSFVRVFPYHSTGTYTIAA